MKTKTMNNKSMKTKNIEEGREKEHSRDGHLFSGVRLAVICFMLLVTGVGVASATAWWNNSWPYRQPINISNTAGNLTNYQVRIDLNSSNVGSNFNWSNNGSDVRFTNSTDDLLNYWIESWNSTGQEATIWVNVTSLPNNTNTTIYMYYGNPSASSASDGDATFEFFDDDFISWGNNPLENAATYQTTPTYDGSNEAVHPDIVYFSNAWNGYKSTVWFN